jgi:hypothetical protein
MQHEVGHILEVLVEPTITTITEGECEWALEDKYGDPYPHGIRARRRVSGAGELLDGIYCIRHAKLAVEWCRVGIEPVF